MMLIVNSCRNDSRLIAFVFDFLAGKCDGATDWQYFSAGDTYFQYVNDRRTWNDSERDCSKEGGTLLGTTSSVEELNFVSTYVVYVFTSNVFFFITELDKQ